jgi:hypothetical protein
MEMGFKGKFWIAALICVAAIFISGKAKYDRAHEVIIHQENLISVNNHLTQQVNILQHEKIELKDSLAIADSSIKKKDTVYVKVVGENEVLVNLNGQDIRTLGREIARALSSDTTKKVNVQVINQRKGLFR